MLFYTRRKIFSLQLDRAMLIQTPTLIKIALSHSLTQRLSDSLPRARSTEHGARMWIGPIPKRRNILSDKTGKIEISNCVPTKCNE